MITETITVTIEAEVSPEFAAALVGDMTPQARDESEGATERAELAAGQCTGTWRNYPHENIRGDVTIYRQHRCGREAPHRGVCRCRYCGRDRGNA